MAASDVAPSSFAYGAAKPTTRRGVARSGKRRATVSPICEASNLAFALASLGRFDEAKALLRRMMPVARRAVGSSHITTLRTRFIYAAALYEDPAATLDDLREAVTTLEDTIRIARRVLGGVHPTTEGIEQDLRDARTALRARVSPEEWRAAARGVKITN